MHYVNVYLFSLSKGSKLLFQDLSCRWRRIPHELAAPSSPYPRFPELSGTHHCWTHRTTSLVSLTMPPLLWTLLPMYIYSWKSQEYQLTVICILSPQSILHIVRHIELHVHKHACVHIHIHPWKLVFKWGTSKDHVFPSSTLLLDKKHVNTTLRRRLLWLYLACLLQ